MALQKVLRYAAEAELYEGGTSTGEIPLRLPASHDMDGVPPFCSGDCRLNKTYDWNATYIKMSASGTSLEGTPG